MKTEPMRKEFKNNRRQTLNKANPSEMETQDGSTLRGKMRKEDNDDGLRRCGRGNGDQI